jgi:hypothetical protein
VRQIETQLLTTVDRRAADELIGRFQQLGAATDPNVRSIKKMSLSVVSSVEELVERQAALWQEALDATQRRWSDSVHTTQEQIQAGFRSALGETMSTHAEALAQAEQLANQRSTQRWEQIQAATHQQNEILSAQRAEMTRQGEVLLRVLGATGDIVKLESALNRNLSALAGAKNFEDTVMSLAATIHLLNSRLSGKHQEMRLQDDTQGKGRAA